MWFFPLFSNVPCDLLIPAGRIHARPLIMLKWYISSSFLNIYKELLYYLKICCVMAFVENLLPDMQQGKIWNQNQAIKKAHLALEVPHRLFLYIL